MGQQPEAVSPVPEHRRIIAQQKGTGEVRISELDQSVNGMVEQK
jgi:hypothetical protein